MQSLEVRMGSGDFIEKNKGAVEISGRNVKNKKEWATKINFIEGFWMDWTKERFKKKEEKGLGNLNQDRPKAFFLSGVGS